MNLLRHESAVEFLYLFEGTDHLKGKIDRLDDHVVVLDRETRDAMNYLVTSLEKHVITHFPFVAVKGADGNAKMTLFALNLEASHLLSVLVKHLGVTKMRGTNFETEKKVRSKRFFPFLS